MLLLEEAQFFSVFVLLQIWQKQSCVCSVKRRIAVICCYGEHTITRHDATEIFIHPITTLWCALNSYGKKQGGINPLFP